MSDLRTPNCINCDSPQVSYDPVFGFYKCANCSEVWGKDEDDPDYEDCKIFDDMDRCPTCNGGGLIQEDGELLSCPRCNGSGSI
jgi:DnaJ-class molecular chaperone